VLPVTAWPPVRPGFWSSPFGAPATVRLSQHPHGFPLPKGCWLVRTQSNSVIFIIRPPDPMEPYWVQPGTGIVHGMGPPPHRPTWPDERWHREDHPHWPHARSDNPSQDTRHGLWPPGHPCHPGPGPGPGPGPHPPGTRIETMVREHSFGIVFADGQNVRIVGTGDANAIKVFSV
jgi:hypothetical protein